MTVRSENLSRRLRGSTFTRGGQSAPAFDLAAIIEAAKRDVGVSGSIEYGDGRIVTDPHQRRDPASLGYAHIRALLPDLLDTDGRVVVTPDAVPAGQRSTIAGAVMQNSRVVQAGAHLVEITQPELIDAAPVPALAKHPVVFRVIEPATFGIVADDAEAPTVAPPWAEDKLDRENTTQRAARFRLTRTELKANGEQELAAEVMRALVLGLGRAVDAELLGALVPLLPDPGAVTWAASQAASRGLRWADLRALVGTAGDGVDLTMTPINGALHVRGVAGEMTPDTAATVIAAFDRFAVAVEPEITVLMQRDAAGGLTFTAWANMQALIPDATFAWRV